MSLLRQFYKSVYLNNMCIVNFAFVESLLLDGYIFGPDFVLEWNGSHFTATWPHFLISEADNLVKVGDVALNLSVSTHWVAAWLAKLTSQHCPTSCCRISAHLVFVASILSGIFYF